MFFFFQNSKVIIVSCFRFEVHLEKNEKNASLIAMISLLTSPWSISREGKKRYHGNKFDKTPVFCFSLCVMTVYITAPHKIPSDSQDVATINEGMMHVF